ncbi:carbamoyl-phosphate synthase L chain, ATP binding domain-containing protein [Talaromyces proteolyticus]|uniref:Carbamoyl-phosphate synthase L chain, ATP binding domain-containing protein n=1 Tax=Talaromyces proteolyticus TaxID=1131652 RepID=A0AAD4KHL4_9EURO|nr:carbamoyl-phosphate synthase L chain, ATP binding domain-containing protein [Talaromyces proteolyticus]KAH8691354.1 carbamoyl-phosphate synthase L chain, ATP binding domain-containing protein [Talaromyces proteolyticus]
MPKTTDTGTACPARPPLFVAQLPVGSDGKPKIQRVLIANRGEIAYRVIEACRTLNITSISVYVQEDEKSRHVSAADEAINIGSINQAGGNPFLNIKLIVKTAVETNADAIHPGYGYLSENAKFADAVRDAGLIFIGPSATAMSTLGDKRMAKDYLREHDPHVPLIPGFTGSSQDNAVLEEAAAKIGYPVMLKASAGGGGRGMRIVHEAAKLKEELLSAQSEATRSFGSGDCILEKYIALGKHIEFQVIGDSHGNVVSLWDRECSIQRRHQKVIEESPSIFLTPEKRQQMSEAALRVGKLLGYENAGTVEFVFDVSDGSFYFLEMNTRLQVEHPITEEVTSLDIVALQFYVAAGGNLKSLPQLDNIPQNGHAIECRLCAEDPQSNFFPEHGTVRFWQTATVALPGLKDTRFETSVETGSRISIHFDSMIAKIVVWAPTRAMAIQKAITALSHTICIGLKTNQRFLQNCLLHPGFQDPAYTTAFIPTNLPKLLSDPYVDVPAALRRSLALIPSVFLHTAAEYIPPLKQSGHFKLVRPGFRNQRRDPVSGQPAVITTGAGESQLFLLVQWNDKTENDKSVIRAKLQPLPIAPASQDRKPSAAAQVTAQYNAISDALRNPTPADLTSHAIEISQAKTALSAGKTSQPWVNASLTVTVDGRAFRVYLSTKNTELGGFSSVAQPKEIYAHVLGFGTWFTLKYYDLLSYCESIRQVAATSQASLKAVSAPMPCKVLSVLKRDGEKVKEGDVVLVVESMKMEMNISAPADGVFKTGVKKNDAVNEGFVLCEIE